MRTQRRIIAIAALVLAGSGLAACDGGGSEEPSATGTETPTATETSTPSPSETTAGPATEIGEITPYNENGFLNDGWNVEHSKPEDGEAPADCYESAHGTGPNTVTCGPTAASLGACWLTEDRMQIACLDEYAVGEQNLKHVALDGEAPAETPATEDPIPLWVELDDGSTFAAVHGGAWSPPEGYLVAYSRADDPETLEEILVPDDDSAPIFDQSEDLWTVTVGEDGGQDVATKTVNKVWYMAGRVIPEGPDDDFSPEIVNGSWCPTPDTEGNATHGCYTIDYPNVEYEDGETDEIVAVSNDGGVLSLDLDGAPLGLYVPADTALDESGMDGVEDLPDQERIWNSQTVTLMVRD